MADALRQGYLQHLREQKVAATEVRGVLREAARESRRIVLSGLPQGATVSDIERLGRAGGAFRALEQVDDQLWEGVSQSTRTRMGAAGRASDEAFERMVATLSRSPVVPADFRRGLIAASRRRAEQVTSNYLAERSLSDAVYRNSQWTKAKVRQTVRLGLVQGKSARNIASEVAGFIDPATPGGARYASFRLARTEINNTFHATSTRAAADAPWVSSLEWRLSASHGAADDCDDIRDDSSGRGYDRGQYRPEDIPDKPHPNCLCYTTEVTPSDTAFADELLGGGYNEWLGQNGLETF